MADPIPKGLSGEDRDAYVALTAMLRQYGLESLASTVLKYIQEGYSQDTITMLLEQTSAYKKRFAGNEARKKAGLPVLSPAEYLATETAYRQIMSAAGLPRGFYDEPSDFTKWISADVSPSEIQDRVTTASRMVSSLDEQTRKQFEKWYTRGDMIAYALDRKRSVEVLDRQWRAAEAGSAATDRGLALNRSLAEQVGELGLGSDQVEAGMASAAVNAKATQKLAGIYGGQYTDADAVEETFLSDLGAQQTRKRLASQERGQFGGSSATSADALTNRRAGQV